jgi:hypothetical protein
MDEKYLQMAIRIRRSYLNLSNDMNLYKKEAKIISEELNRIVKEIDQISVKNENNKQDNKTNNFEVDCLKKLLKSLDEIVEEGDRLEKLVKPISDKVEMLAKEESELYRMITENYPNMTTDEIVKYVRDRLIMEGLF